MRRPVKLSIQILVSGGVIAFLLWSIDIEQTVEIIRDSHWGYVLAAFAIFLGTTWLMAWRWGALLKAKGVHEPFSWLLKMYFVSYAAGQVLPTAVGGDAVRIIEHSRRRPDARRRPPAAVFMERVLGSAATLVLVAVGLAVAVGRYDDVALPRRPRGRLRRGDDRPRAPALLPTPRRSPSSAASSRSGAGSSWRSRSRASTGRCTSTGSLPARSRRCSA